MVVWIDTTEFTVTESVPGDVVKLDHTRSYIVFTALTDEITEKDKMMLANNCKNTLKNKDFPDKAKKIAPNIWRYETIITYSK